ncbi:RNA polymerase sigma factor [Cellulomonas fimi]|uniref:RNA polymerase, sigma-24 subunit, ECF subfamily n=1 Tax=Cellulomonas fimi (strain ATCC 484 / DSM 20113 / JCM 1341 / CCUG 24087 / LMG 16345 / NBRC 15513 / NCIMB 8980 / NCTC 7547 / NRS-133) TaxID=590998 RepID=F4H6Z8_CELFA|nr:RNA polymerase sigma factor [Cellulomonas fimi]AEE44507.1 RNA polymerase, sigma-24 subunit, ECF subfamily [Cellulomonas fimi ATCC 484]VEH26499.1 Sigma-24 [Cellulomonas fimi]
MSHHDDTLRLAALWDRYAARVQAYALRHVDPDTAQEVVSETFLVAWRRLVDVPGDPLPWLLVVARNTVANQRRSQHRARVVADEVARLERVMPAHDEHAGALVVERDALLRALAALSAREREALLLVAWDGLDPTAAAAVVGCTPGAFKVRLHRARRRLDAALDTTDDTPAPGAPRTPRAAPTTPRTATAPTTRG